MSASLDASDEARYRNRRFVLFLLIVVYTLNFLDRQILSILKEPIAAELHLSDSDLGLLGGFAFALFYSVLALPAAWLADRFSRVWMMTGALDFSHTLPTETVGTDCGKVEKPFLGKCGFDAAGAIFAALYGPAPRAAGTPAGELRRFDQNAFKPGGADALLADNGYVYVPPACAQGKACGVLVALHGCQQNADNVGEAFVRDAGFNRWADAYDVAVLYPQTRVNYTPLNPKACWDWFGYSGANYDSRDSVQLRWLTNALAALGLPRR